VNTGDQVTVQLRGEARIAGILRSIEGGNVHVATRFGTVVRPLSAARPMDKGFTLNAAALAEIERKNK